MAETNLLSRSVEDMGPGWQTMKLNGLALPRCWKILGPGQRAALGHLNPWPVNIPKDFVWFSFGSMINHDNLFMGPMYFGYEDGMTNHLLAAKASYYLVPLLWVDFLGLLAFLAGGMGWILKGWRSFSTLTNPSTCGSWDSDAGRLDIQKWLKSAVLDLNLDLPRFCWLWHLRWWSSPSFCCLKSPNYFKKDMASQILLHWSQDVMFPWCFPITRVTSCAMAYFWTSFHISWEPQECTDCPELRIPLSCKIRLQPRGRGVFCRGWFWVKIRENIIVGPQSCYVC